MAIYGVNYSPEPTGIGPYTAELAEHLVALGTNVRVITTFAHYPHWEVGAADRRKMRRREVLRGVSVTRLWSRMPKPMTGVQRLIFEMSYSVLALGHGPGDAEVVVGIIPGLGSGLAAMLHGRLRRREVVIVVQDLAGQGLKQSGMTRARRIGKLASWAEGFAVRRAHRVIAISGAFVEPLAAMGVRYDRIRVLPNWGRVSKLADPLPPLSDPPVLLHAGSMGLKQGLEQIVEAARLAHAEGLDYRFLVVGDGSERDRLEDLGAGLPNLEFRDPAPDDDFPALLASANVLLMCQAPSNIDMSFPSKLTAYLASGRPVVAAVPCGGSVDKFLRRTKVGLSVEAESPVALLSALKTLLADAHLQDSLAHAGETFVEEEWNRDQLLVQWSDAVRELP